MVEHLFNSLSQRINHSFPTPLPECRKFCIPPSFYHLKKKRDLYWNSTPLLIEIEMYQKTQTKPKSAYSEKEIEKIMETAHKIEELQKKPGFKKAVKKFIAQLS